MGCCEGNNGDVRLYTYIFDEKLQQNCCMYLGTKIDDCCSGNYQKKNSISFHKSISEYLNTKNNNIDYNDDDKDNIDTKKGQYYESPGNNNNNQLEYEYKNMVIHEGDNVDNTYDIKMNNNNNYNNIYNNNYNRQLNNNVIENNKNNNIDDNNYIQPLNNNTTKGKTEFINNNNNGVDYNNNINNKIIYDYNNNNDFINNNDNNLINNNNQSNNKNENENEDVKEGVKEDKNEEKNNENEKNNSQQNNLFEETPALRNNGGINNNNYSSKQIGSVDKEEIEESQNQEIHKIIIENEKNETNNSKINGEKINEELPKNKSQKEIYNDGEKIRSKLMDRINRGRARSSDNKKKNDIKSNDILMKAKLLEKVLGNIKKPEDLNDGNFNTQITKKENNNNDAFESNQKQLENIPVVNQKKKKKNNIPFKE